MTEALREAEARLAYERNRLELLAYDLNISMGYLGAEDLIEIAIEVGRLRALAEQRARTTCQCGQFFEHPVHGLRNMAGHAPRPPEPIQTEGGHP